MNNMKKISYCKECGSKIVNGNFCPICGEKINNGGVKMDKNRHTRKILLIILAITIIAGAIIVSTALLNHNQRVQITDTASLELPVGNGIKGEIVTGTNVHKLSNGKGVVVMAYNSKERNLASSFSFALLKEFAVGGKDNEDQIYETTVNGSKVYSIATGNDTTHDNILISTHSKEDTLNIYHSIKYNASNVKNTTNKTADNSTTSTSNQQKSGNTANHNNNVNPDKPADIDDKTYKAICDTYGSYANYQKVLDKQAEIRSYGSEEAYDTAHGYPNPSSDTGGSGSGGNAYISTAT